MKAKKKEHRHAESIRRLREAKVKDIMNRKPQTVSPETSIDDLLERLRGQIEDCFPVVNKNRKLLGIVTESDLLHVLHPPAARATVGSVKEAMKSGASTAGQIMTKRPVTATPEMTVSQVLNLMVAHKLRHLPVVEGERLVGLVSLRDIIEFYRLLK